MSEEPSIFDLRGMAPDATGSLSSEEFVRNIRMRQEVVILEVEAAAYRRGLERAAEIADSFATPNIAEMFVNDVAAAIRAEAEKGWS